MISVSSPYPSCYDTENAAAEAVFFGKTVPRQRIRFAFIQADFLMVFSFLTSLRLGYIMI